MQAIVISSDQNEEELFAYLLRRDGHVVIVTANADKILERWTDHPADVLW